jgi:hypothetical protein
VAVIATNWWLVGLATLLGGGLLALVLVPLVARWRRAEPLGPPPVPPRPANEVALEALETLERAEIDPAQRYAGVVDTLRAYLGGRYGVDAMESTSAELMMQVALLEMSGVATTEIGAILDDADLVKFAKLVPSEAEAMTLLDRVREIVLTTWEEPAAQEEPGPEPEPGTPHEAGPPPLPETPGAPTPEPPVQSPDEPVTPPAELSSLSASPEDGERS